MLYECKKFAFIPVKTTIDKKWVFLKTYYAIEEQLWYLCSTVKTKSTPFKKSKNIQREF